jgi:hypothetical protein
MEIIGTINTRYGRADIRKSYYADGNKALLVVNSDTEEILTKLSVNLDTDVPLDKDEYLIKTWSENEEIARTALESGLFTDTGKWVPAGWVEAQVWRVL